MRNDVEFLRRLLLYLEERQVSPRATIIIDMEADAFDLDCDARMLKESLNLLLDLDYIEGPGLDDAVWLFRKLSRKGALFLDTVRHPADWDRLKRRYADTFKPNES